MNVFVQLVISWQDNYLFFIINYYMKTSSHVSLTGPRGERGWGMLPHPRLPVGGENFPVYIPVGEEISTSPSPNRGIPRGESGIGSPLPSLQEEFEFYLSDSEARLLVTNAEGNAAAQATAAKLGLAHAAASLHDAAGPVHLAGLPVPALENGSHGGGAAGSLSPNDPSDVALFLHTSGTTSRPKGVPLKQRNLAASVRNIRSVYRLAETDATVVVLPLFHVHGLLCALLSSLASGASVALPAAGRFSASTFWADMRASGATWYTAVPTIHQIILDRHASRPEAYPALRFIRSCSASLAPAILERLEAAFSAPVLEAYAMTEASHLMTSNPLPEDGPRKPGSVGRAVGQELAVLDEEGRLVAAGSPGEVCVRGDNVTAGYKGNPEANEAAFRFGWFHTGDIGVVDDQGYVRLVGRIKGSSTAVGRRSPRSRWTPCCWASPAWRRRCRSGCLTTSTERRSTAR
jgi:oxalate---CoA ligase